MSDSDGRLFQVTITRTYTAFLVARDKWDAELEASGLAHEIVSDYYEPDEDVSAIEVRHAPDDGDEGRSLPYGELAREHDTRTVRQWWELGEDRRREEAKARRDAKAQVPLFGGAK